LLYSRYATSLSPAAVEIVAVFSVYALGSKTSASAAADEVVEAPVVDVLDEVDVHAAVTRRRRPARRHPTATDETSPPCALLTLRRELCR
jgi:hypothetical protein